MYARLGGSQPIDLLRAASPIYCEPDLVSRPLFGDAHEITIGLRYLLSRSVVDNPDATKQDLRGAKGELEDLLRTTRRVFGTSHPRFEIVQDAIEKANENIETRRANIRP